MSPENGYIYYIGFSKIHKTDFIKFGLHGLYFLAESLGIFQIILAFLKQIVYALFQEANSGESHIWSAEGVRQTNANLSGKRTEHTMPKGIRLSTLFRGSFHLQ